MLSHPFMQHALLAGVPIAALAGLVGYFLVLRQQVFTGDALSHVSFTGAISAIALGLDARLGLFAATIGVALVLGALGRRGVADDVVIGTVFAWVLGLGVLALSLYSTGPRARTDGAAGAHVLFGSIFGLSAGQARDAGVVALVLCAVLLIAARPLLFASLDHAVAAARGIRVRGLGMAFLLVTAACAAEASQAVGALLLLGLVAAPAAAAHRLAASPFAALALSCALSVASMVLGLVASYLLPTVPPSFFIISVASAAYAASFLGRPVSALHAHPA